MFIIQRSLLFTLFCIILAAAMDEEGQQCRTSQKPENVTQFQCVYFAPDCQGLPGSRFAFNQTLKDGNVTVKYALAGWMSPAKSGPATPISFDDFKSKKISLQGANVYAYDDVANSSVIDCGMYRQYLKYGSHNGFMFEEWLDNYEFCINKHVSMSQATNLTCRFNGWFNCVSRIYIAHYKDTLSDTLQHKCRSGFQDKICMDKRPTMGCHGDNNDFIYE